MFSGIEAAAPRWIDLDSEWGFTCEPDVEGNGGGRRLADISLPRTAMPIPGFWDDHTDRLAAAGLLDAMRRNPSHEPIRVPMDNPPPDASLPHLVGLGQYEVTFDAPPEGRVTFECGPAFLEAWLWVNGERVAHQPHYSTRWSVQLDGPVMPGERNHLALQLSNADPRTKGCITRGFKGYSAGIAGPALLRVTGPARLADCYVHLHPTEALLQWNVELDHPGGSGATLRYRVVDPETGEAVVEGEQTVRPGENHFATDAAGLCPWSDRSPVLYRLELTLHGDGAISDELTRSLGVRRITREGFGLRLNGSPIYLRGATEHAYFPETCTVPLDKRVHRQHIAKLKRLGFNWLRFHTWVPPEPYLEAADELGMLVQVEPPAGADDREWCDILRACRKHPSVVLYCGGNEELLDEGKLDALEQWSKLCRDITPDALFSPQEALRGVEYGWNEADLGPDAVAEPYLHNPRRLERLKTFSDAFGQFSWGMLSYHSTAADPEVIDERLEPYQRPCLSHELAIHGSYLDLDLEHRYEDTRIGTTLYAEVRRHLRERGLEHRAAEYYAASSGWMRSLRKHAVESARRCRRLAGYDLLGAIDHHWHRTGYPCGIMNEFYALKQGESEDHVRRYNAASVLLLDRGGRWSCFAGDAWRARLDASIFEPEAPGGGRVEWVLCNDETGVLRRGESEVDTLHNGGLTDLGEIEFDAPDLTKPILLTLVARLRTKALELENRWPIWLYPRPTPPRGQVVADPDLLERWQPVLGRSLTSRGPYRALLTTTLGNAEIDRLESGGVVVLLGGGPLPARVTVFQIACAGRVEGTFGTRIADHPITDGLPHSGFCDWDFQTMLDRGEAIHLDETGVRPEPIIEVVSSFKDADLLATLFELRVGPGRLLVCSLGLTPDDPASTWLLGRIIEYTDSQVFAPTTRATPDLLRRLVRRAPAKQAATQTDEGFDERAALTSW